jgi:hypothetical protein
MQEGLYGYRLLSTGDLSFLYRQGEIRRICVGDTQVINAIYGAVRDRNWGTVPFRITHENIQKDGLAIRMDVVLQYEQSDIAYKAEIQIQAEPQSVRFRFRGGALSSFLRNRIGICVLLPVNECKGQAMTILHPDGSISETNFPEHISPDQPGLNMTGMRWKASGQLDSELDFYGEVFEMEDQRNWTDASYKTYGTPLDLPFPVQVHAGDEIEQSVHLKIASTQVHQKALKDQGIKVTLKGKPSYPIPLLGVGSTNDRDPVSKAEAALVKRIPFHHMRADLKLGHTEWVQQYERTLAEQELLGWPAELGLHFHQHYEAECNAFIQLQSKLKLELSAILIFGRDHMSDNALLKQVLPHIREAFPQIPLGGGTNAYFAELNRSRLDADDLDFISYSICPQVHADDRLTLLENLEAQGDTLRSARQLYQKPVHIGALSLRQRFNIVATDKNDESPSYPLSDPRQKTAFGAGWTMVSIRQLANAGASAMTYFETVGLRGLLDRTNKSPEPYPVFYVLEELLSEKKQLLHVNSSDPLLVEAVALQNDRETTLLMVNLTETEQRVDLGVMDKEVAHHFILAEHGWNAIPAARLGRLYMHAASIYKIILRS